MFHTSVVPSRSAREPVSLATELWLRALVIGARRGAMVRMRGVIALLGVVVVFGCGSGPSGSRAAAPQRSAVVSSRTELRVPDVVGMRATDGVAAIVNSGFKVLAPGLRPWVPYLVTAQSPHGGSLAARTTTVRLTVRRIPPAPECRKDQVSVHLAGASDDRSMGRHLLGFMIVVRNHSRAACSVAGPPRLRFIDNSGDVLAIRPAEGDHEDAYTVLAAADTAPPWVSTASTNVALLAADTCSGASSKPRYVEVVTARVVARLALPWSRRVCTTGATVDAFGSDD